MIGVNKVILLGNVGQNPKITTTVSGSKVASFSLATSDTYTDKTTNTRKVITEWHRIVVFNSALIPIIENMVQKGTRLLVEGELRTRKYQNSNGVEMTSTDVVLRQYRGTLVCISNLAKEAMPESADEYGITSVQEQESPQALNVAALDEAQAFMNDPESIPF